MLSFGVGVGRQNDPARSSAGDPSFSSRPCRAQTAGSDDGPRPPCLHCMLSSLSVHGTIGSPGFSVAPLGPAFDFDFGPQPQPQASMVGLGWTSRRQARWDTRAGAVVSDARPGQPAPSVKERGGGEGAGMPSASRQGERAGVGCGLGQRSTERFLKGWHDMPLGNRHAKRGSLFMDSKHMDGLRGSDTPCLTQATRMFVNSAPTWGHGYRSDRSLREHY